MFSSIGRAVKKAGAAVGSAAKAGAGAGQSCGPGNAATQDSMRSGIVLTSGKGGATRPPTTRPKPVDSGSLSTTQIGYPGSGQCGPSVQPAIYRPPADQGAAAPMWV